MTDVELELVSRVAAEAAAAAYREGLAEGRRQAMLDLLDEPVGTWSANGPTREELAEVRRAGSTPEAVVEFLTRMRRENEVAATRTLRAVA